MLEGSGAVLQRVNLNRLASSLRLLSDELLNITVDDLKQMQWSTRLRIYPALFEAHNRTLDVGEQLRALIAQQRQFGRQATSSREVLSFRRRFAALVLTGLRSTGWRFAVPVTVTREDGDEQPQVEDEERLDEFMARKDLLLDSFAHLVQFISGNETRESRATTSRSHDGRASASASTTANTTATQERSSIAAAITLSEPATPQSQVTQQGGRPVSSPIAIPASPRVERPSRQTAHMSASVASEPATSTTAAASLPQLSVSYVNLLEHENRQLRRQLRMAVQAVRARDQAEARIGNIIDALCCTVRSIAEIAPAEQIASAMPATSNAGKASAGEQADSGAVRSQKAASTWRELLRTVEQLHQAWVEANRTASKVVAASMAQGGVRARVTDEDALPRNRVTPSQLRAAQVVGSSASVSVSEQSHLSDRSVTSSLTDYQHEQLCSSIASLVEGLQQRAGTMTEADAELAIASQDVLLRLSLAGKHPYAFNSYQDEQSRHQTALDDFEHALAQSYHVLRRKVPPEVEDGLRRVRQQFDAAVDGLRTARSQLLAVSNHSHVVSRRIAENSKSSSRHIQDALRKIQDQAWQLKALDEHIQQAQQARIEWPGSHAPKMVRPFEMVSRGYLGSEMAGLSLFLHEYAGEVSQLHTLIEEVSSRLQAREKSFSAKLESSTRELSQLDLSGSI